MCVGFGPSLLSKERDSGLALAEEADQRKRHSRESEDASSSSVEAPVTSSSPQCKRARTTGKRVRFGSTIRAISSTSPENEEPIHLWYTPEDCAAMNGASRKHIQSFCQQNRDSVRHMLCVASQCTYSPPPTAYLEMVKLSLPDDVRGLEMGMLSRNFRQQRKTHRREVLQHQTSILHNSPRLSKNVPREESLALHARRSSQASQIFAQLVARDCAIMAKEFCTE
jgi:hypothetical protein